MFVYKYLVDIFVDGWVDRQTRIFCNEFVLGFSYTKGRMRVAFFETGTDFLKREYGRVSSKRDCGNLQEMTVDPELIFPILTVGRAYISISYGLKSEGNVVYGFPTARKKHELGRRLNKSIDRLLQEFKNE